MCVFLRSRRRKGRRRDNRRKEEERQERNKNKTKVLTSHYENNMTKTEQRMVLKAHRAVLIG